MLNRPIAPIVVSNTVQEFEGRNFWLCGRYFQRPRDGEILHRKVWERNRGHIPPGFQIHHIDEDRTNNAIENLECLTPQEHLGVRHSHEPALASARAWHATDEGFAWHSRHYREKLKPVFSKMAAVHCVICGAERQVRAVDINRTKTCGDRCRATKKRRDKRTSDARI